ncbi:unnamed protein product [Durusdinium trenchii]|uniref:Uncharacterized protein n=1 Tax=Durusdinium trenchii TaxID=1381693 RepID=A0ABP0R9D1_9DINO
MASGHINPSLAIARRLVRQGHAVHYLSREQMREAIEDTGARFHSDIAEQPELFEDRDPSMYGALGSLQEEHGLKTGSLSKARLVLRELAVELMLPGTLRWLHTIEAHAVLFCPLINLEAPLAAKVAKLPSAGLCTVAGPGSVQLAWSNTLSSLPPGNVDQHVFLGRAMLSIFSLCLLDRTFHEIKQVEDHLRPLGLLRTALTSDVTLVTTAECLADPVPLDLTKAYEGHPFMYLGPLLDEPGAKRAGGHKFDSQRDHMDDEKPLALARAAKAEGRKVVLDYGWKAHETVNGEKRGLTGKELCQAAWQAVFDVFGEADGADAQTPLTCLGGQWGKETALRLALGPQADALENLQVPPNAYCQPILPQVDLLRLGLDVFLTHGGQNSFMEALSTGIPMVLCPGFGDQPVNGAKAESMKLGVCVPRPKGPLHEAETERAAYRKATALALQRVTSNGSFKENAVRCAEALRSSGGVSLATKVLLSLAQGSSKSGDLAQIQRNGGA